MAYQFDLGVEVLDLDVVSDILVLAVHVESLHLGELLETVISLQHSHSQTLT
jgi:hypothetical protein